MHHKFIKSIFLVCATFLFTACNSNMKDPKTLVLGTDPTYSPYERIGPDGQCEGFDIDVAQAIAKKLNKTLVIKQFGFTALILALKQDKVDFVLAGMSITPSREKEITMIPYQGDPVTSLQLVFWEKAPQEVQKITDLNLVAVMVGTCEEDYLREFPSITYKSLENTTEIMMDLQYGKSQAALIESKVAKVLQKQFPEIQLVEIPLEEKDWTIGKGVGMEKSNSLLAEQVRCAIEELKAEGTLKKLEEKWM